MSPGRAATFGTVVAIDGGVSDLVLDEARGRLYAVNSPQNRVEIYDTVNKVLLSPVSTAGQPLSAALSSDGQSLYVADYGGSTLDVINLNSLVTTSHVTLPGAPEGVAVGGDGRVLITTSGTTTSTNNLLLYDPVSGNVSPLSIAPPAPTSAGLAPTSGQVYNISRSHLESSRDGRYIVGLNNPTATTRQVFVYEVASGSVLRSRSVTSISSVLSVAADGSMVQRERLQPELRPATRVQHSDAVVRFQRGPRTACEQLGPFGHQEYPNQGEVADPVHCGVY